MPAERLLELARRGPDRVEVGGRGDPRRRADRALQLERRASASSIPCGLLGHPQPRELRPELLEVAAARELAGELAQRRRSTRPRGRARARRPARSVGVEHEPLAGVVVAERDQVARAAPERRLGREHAATGP